MQLFLLNTVVFLTLFQSVASYDEIQANRTTAEIVRRKNGPINAVYFVNWGIYDRHFQPADLPVEKITHLLYAFMNLREDGTVFSGDTYADLEKHYPNDSWSEPGQNAYGCVKQLYKLKSAHRHLKTMLSIGGWSWSANFPIAAATQQGRDTFAQTSVAFMKNWGFDGIDIDWEYPDNDEEANNMVLLLRRIRQELDVYASEHTPGRHYELSIAAPAGSQHYEKLNIAQMDPLLDHINLMAYDFTGSWDTLSGHQANLYPSQTNPASTPFSIAAAVNAYLSGGITAEKLILGMPIYGRAFVGTTGLGKPFASTGVGSWETGVWDYKALPRAGGTVIYDSEAGATYEKIEYAQGLGLGGSMFWEASADKGGAESLINAAVQKMGGIDMSQNQLDYPDSIYDNIRNRLQ